ncbi:MAG: helix-turn-helix transcriptional regulator [Mycobacterium sp.]|nr:helix-turn-helix transcriptional regulator [Mycobacterium sp.]
MTVPSAYLHPRFQGQEPPGFPGRFNSAEYQRLCALLRQLRRDADLTQVEVAERLGVPQSFVSKYETGERRLDVIELGHVAAAIGATLHEVVRLIDGE